MSSSVFFKFKSQREPVRVTFDGTGISVFELKRNIITINRLGDGTDFDLSIYNEDTNEEYQDDTTVIPRSSSIIARRLPSIKPGRGTAGRYVSGKMPVNALNPSRADRAAPKPPSNQQKPAVPKAPTTEVTGKTEEERIAAMFQAGAEQWNQTQQEMAQATPVFRAGGKGKPMNVAVPAHPPPNGYICYRCGEKGHWIQECPTNNDPDFDGRPRIKRTTGIPRSFLKTVEKPAALEDGAAEEIQRPSGVMVDAEGKYVVAEPDKASWEQYQAKTKVSAAARDSDQTGNAELLERGLECPIDKKLFVDPTKTPCCGTIYCNDCVTNALIENDLTCPNCQSEGILLDDLTVDPETSAKLKTYIKEKEEAAKRREKESSQQRDAKSPKPDEIQEKKSSEQSSQPTINGETTKSPSRDVKSQTPKDTFRSPKSNDGLQSTDANSKKRPAPEEAEDQPAAKSAATETNNEQKDRPQSATPQPNSITNSNGQQPFNPPSGTMGFNNFQGPFNPLATTGMGMPGMPFMMDPMMMNGFNGMGGSMGQMNANGMGFPQQGGMFPPVGFQGFPDPNMFNGMGFNMGPNGQANNNNNGMNNNSAFANQQRPGENDEDNAYFRQPVNPHRHQARQRRIRPSDYREL